MVKWSVVVSEERERRGRELIKKLVHSRVHSIGKFSGYGYKVEKEKI